MTGVEKITSGSLPVARPVLPKKETNLKEKPAPQKSEEPGQLTTPHKAEEINLEKLYGESEAALLRVRQLINDIEDNNVKLFNEALAANVADLVELFFEAYDHKTGQVKSEKAFEKIKLRLEAFGQAGINSREISIFAELTNPELLPEDRALFLNFLTNQEAVQENIFKIAERFGQLTREATRQFLENKGRTPWEKTQSGRAFTAGQKFLRRLNNPIFEEKIIYLQLKKMQEVIKQANENLYNLLVSDEQLFQNYSQDSSPDNLQKILSRYVEIFTAELGTLFGSRNYCSRQLRKIYFEKFLSISEVPPSEIEKLSNRLIGIPNTGTAETARSLSTQLQEVQATQEKSDDYNFQKDYREWLKGNFSKIFSRVKANLESIQQRQERLNQISVDFLQRGISALPNLLEGLIFPSRFEAGTFQNLSEHWKNILDEQSQLAKKSSDLEGILNLYGMLHQLIKEIDPKWLTEFESSNFPPDFIQKSASLYGYQINQVANFEWPREIKDFLNQKTYQGKTYADFFKDDLVFLAPSLKMGKIISLFVGAGAQESEMAGGGFTNAPPFIFTDNFAEESFENVSPYTIFCTLAHEGHHSYWARAVKDPQLKSSTINEGAAYLFGAKTAKQLIEFLKSKNKPIPEELFLDYLGQTLSFWAALDVLDIAEKPLPQETTPEMFQKLPAEILKSRNLDVYPTNSTFFKSCLIAQYFLTDSRNPQKISLSDLTTNPKKILPLAQKINSILTEEKTIPDAKLPEEVKNILSERIKDFFQRINGQEPDSKNFEELLKKFTEKLVLQQTLKSMGGLSGTKISPEIIQKIQPILEQVNAPGFFKLTPDEETKLIRDLYEALEALKIIKDKVSFEEFEKRIRAETIDDSLIFQIIVGG